jgi:hypothetical protein
MNSLSYIEKNPIKSLLGTWLNSNLNANKTNARESRSSYVLFDPFEDGKKANIPPSKNALGLIPSVFLKYDVNSVNKAIVCAFKIE